MELGPRMAAFRGISHCYQRPTYADWPYSVFTMAHGRSKEECDAILDSIAEDTGIEERARSTRRPSSRRSASSTSPTSTAGGRARARLTETPLGRGLTRGPPAAAGRGELAGAGDALDRPRPDLRRARRGRRADRRRRQPLRRLGHVLGPADRRPRPSRRRGRRDRRRRAGTSYGAPTEAEVELAAEVVERVPAAEMVRMTSSRHRGRDERDPAGARRHRPRRDRSSSPAPTTATWTACWPTPAPGWPRRASRPARA